MAAKRQPPDYRKGWNGALRALHAQLTLLPPETRLPLLRTIHPITAALRLRKRRGGTKEELARKYSICPRTVSTWRMAGCPFERGHLHVIDWAVKRRSLPDSFRRRFRKDLHKRQWQCRTKDIKVLLADLNAYKLLCRSAGEPLPPWFREGQRLFRASVEMPMTRDALVRIQAALCGAGEPERETGAEVETWTPGRLAMLHEYGLRVRMELLERMDAYGEELAQVDAEELFRCASSMRRLATTAFELNPVKRRKSYLSNT